MTYAWEIDPKDIQLHEIIGEGAFAEVYTGTHKGCPVAIKKLRPKFLCKSAKERFVREVNALYSLNHENVAVLIGACISTGMNCIVMELLPYNLKELVGTSEPEKYGWKVFTWRDKLKILYAIGLTIGTLHKKKTLHRDIKADNIMLDETMTIPKLIDFGLVQTATSTIATAVQSNIAIGTLNWMSPQVLKGRYSVAGEVWSYGCLIYEVLTGVPPFAREFPDKDALRSFLLDPNSDLSCVELKGERFRPVNGIIRACIQHDVEKRRPLTDVLALMKILIDSKDAWLDTPSLPEPWEPFTEEFDLNSQPIEPMPEKTGSVHRSIQVASFLNKYPLVDSLIPSLKKKLDNNEKFEKEIEERSKILEDTRLRLVEEEKRLDEELAEKRRLHKEAKEKAKKEEEEMERKRREAKEEKERMERESKRLQEEKEKAEREARRLEEESRRRKEERERIEREYQRRQEENRRMERQRLEDERAANEMRRLSMASAAEDYFSMLASPPSTSYTSAPSYSAPRHSAPPQSYSRPAPSNPFPGRSTGSFWASSGSANGREIFQGPRGGSYYINSNGNRTYVKP